MTLDYLEYELGLIAEQMDVVKKMLDIASEDTHSEQKEKT